MADTTDPVTAEPTGVPVPPLAPRKSSALPLVAGGVVAAVIGLGAAQFLPNGWFAADTSALHARLDAQTAELTALKTTVAQLTQAPAPPADKALIDRMTAVETTLAVPVPEPDLSPLIARLDALDQAVTTLTSRPVSVGSADPADLAALQSQIDELANGGISATALAEATAAIDAKLAEADVKVAGVKAEAEAIAVAAAHRAALQQLQAALDSGAPFTSALAGLGAMSLPPVLADHAASGLPTLQALRQDFPAAARAALDAALAANMGESWTDRVTAFLRNQTGARSLTPRDGNDPDAVLSRAEAALGSGNLTTALAEIAALPPEGQTAMAGWLDSARLRQDAAQAVQILVTAAGQ